MDAENAVDPATETRITLVSFDTDHDAYFAGQCPHPRWVLGHVALGTSIVCSGCATSHRIDRVVHTHVNADPVTLFAELLAQQCPPPPAPASVR